MTSEDVLVHIKLCILGRNFLIQELDLPQILVEVVRVLCYDILLQPNQVSLESFLRLPVIVNGLLQIVNPFL